MDILTILFLGFCSLIIICQLVPATILFIGMIRALFKPTHKELSK